MDIVLVCNVSNLYKALNEIFLTTLNTKYDLDIKIDYPKSRLLINIIGDKGAPMYIKKCRIEEVPRELKKIESIY